MEIAGQHKQTYAYADFDRIESLTELINGTKTLVKQMSYDDYGRVTRETFPSGYYTENHYDEYGNLYKVTDSNTPTRVIWEAKEANARGQLTKMMKGAKEAIYGYDDTKGQLTSIFASGVVSYNYGYDTKNNLAFRTDNLTNQKEIFTYDTQNRLINWDIRNASTQALLKANSIAYDANTGNITGKSDLNVPGNVMFNYDNPDRLHALTGISPKPDVISNDELAVTYTDFRKIKTLTDGTKQYHLTYGVDDQRRMSVQTQGGNTLTKYYFGNYEEEISETNTRKIHYLSGAIYVDNTNSADSLYYVYTDNQGSVIALTDESGVVKRKYAYDPWGARRNPANWTQPDNGSNLIISRGYTGHEHLDMFNIINMNGRVYDPLTAMFFSPDPFIQSPGNWNNYNRYSYCMNNPTRYTDPSGYISMQMMSNAEYDQWYNEFCKAFWSHSRGGGSGESSHWWDTLPEYNSHFEIDLWEAYLDAKSQDWIGDFNDFVNIYYNQSSTVGFDGTMTLHNYNNFSETNNTGEFVRVSKKKETFYVEVWRDSQGQGGDKSEPWLTVNFNRGILQIETNFIDKDWGAITPGPFIVYSKDGSKNKYYNTHEPGHVIQFLIFGPVAYYGLVAIPSLTSSTTTFHDEMPWEKSANQLWYWLTGENYPDNKLYFGPNKK